MKFGGILYCNADDVLCNLVEELFSAYSAATSVHKHITFLLTFFISLIFFTASIIAGELQCVVALRSL